MSILNADVRPFNAHLIFSNGKCDIGCATLVVISSLISSCGSYNMIDVYLRLIEYEYDYYYSIIKYKKQQQ